MTTRTPVEVSTRYATTVDDLASAWAFVMERLDGVGPDPQISITPVWTVTADLTEGDPTPRHFSVVVEGMVPEAEEGDR